MRVPGYQHREESVVAVQVSKRRKGSRAQQTECCTAGRVGCAPGGRLEAVALDFCFPSKVSRRDVCQQPGGRMALQVALTGYGRMTEGCVPGSRGS